MGILDEKKIALISLGCDKNLADSEVMLGILSEEGAITTVDEELADIIIINTCGFIADATDESVQTVFRALEYKKERNVAVIVAGCAAARYREKIFEEIPDIDAIVAPTDIADLPKIAADVLKGQKICAVSDPDTSIPEEILEKRVLTGESYAYLKIAEGCDNRCTYCTIPSLRGKYRSRSEDALLREANALAANGTKEIILVAQDTSLYGTDIYGKQTLHRLLQNLSQIEGIRWIRLLYCYPEHIYSELIQEMATNEKVCKYIDMPIQHSETSVLEAMGRHSSKESVISVIENLRSRVKGIIIRTTIMTGFPTESKTDFQNLLAFLKEVRFDKLGAFSYSQEEGTKAAEMPQLSEKTRETRKNRVMELQAAISQEEQKKFVGGVYDCFVGGAVPYEKNMYFGRIYADAPDVDGVTYFSAKQKLSSGDFVKVRITNSLEYDLEGEII
ncbi:MAG: 30S ribosomal protein S12 methylthiotransferase RimO [Clostridiales bacterium]|jgi:ribosomal protein S12 methylthiotransferase|nr:30S ribosomal protein S12 methylthiotransferase RimO [Clostridiales bacterium]